MNHPEEHDFDPFDPSGDPAMKVDPFDDPGLLGLLTEADATRGLGATPVSPGDRERRAARLAALVERGRAATPSEGARVLEGIAEAWFLDGSDAPSDASAEIFVDIVLAASQMDRPFVVVEALLAMAVRYARTGIEGPSAAFGESGWDHYSEYLRNDVLHPIHDSVVQLIELLDE